MLALMHSRISATALISLPHSTVVDTGNIHGAELKLKYLISLLGENRHKQLST